MPRQYSFPCYFDELLQISISDLKRWNYLNNKKKSSGVLTWSVRGEKTGSISFTIDTITDIPNMELNYKVNNMSYSITVNLTTKESNLKTGKIWYFLCPYTGKRCRKLYFKDDKFAHREAHTNCMYELQTFSKKDRDLVRLMTPKFEEKKLSNELDVKHFKRYYAGKETKRFKKIQAQLHLAKKLSLKEMLYSLIK